MERDRHSTIKVGDYLYMWGGLQPGLPYVHDSEEKRAMCSVMEVCRLVSGRWEQKPTTDGTPPLGIISYAAAAIGNEIFFYGGYCSHLGCYHNSLFSFNVDTFNWKELSPTTPHHGPRMKCYCDMVAVQLDGEDYLVVIGGYGPSDNNTPKQPGAQYSGDRCNEIHYYKLSSGQCMCVCVHVCLCVCVCYVSYYNSRVVSLPICYSLGCSSKLAPRLEVLYSFSELTDIPSPHGRPGFYHFGTLGLCYLCMGLLYVEYQTGSHSPALRTGYDGLRRLYGIPTLPALCDPFCSHGVIFNVWPHITLL